MKTKNRCVPYVWSLEGGNALCIRAHPSHGESRAQLLPVPLLPNSRVGFPGPELVRERQGESRVLMKGTYMYI